MRYSLRLTLKLSPLYAKIIRRSLAPEMKWRAEWCAKLSVHEDGLVVELKSQSLSRMRAASNTLLRWMEMVEGVVDLLGEGA